MKEKEIQINCLKERRKNVGKNKLFAKSIELICSKTRQNLSAVQFHKEIEKIGKGAESDL